MAQVKEDIRKQNNEAEVPEFLKNIDWNMLRTQKASLVAVIGYYRHNDVPFIPEHLEGILALLDAVQDYAIDDVEIVEAIKEDQEFVDLMNVPDESPEQRFARENAELIFQTHINSDALYVYEDRSAPNAFIKATVNNRFHSNIIKARIQEAIYKDVTRYPKDFKRDDDGIWYFIDFKSETSEYGLLVGKYCEEIYPE